MNISSDGYIALGLSIVVAVLVDLAVFRVLLEFLRPASRYLFWAGRASKIAAASAWAVYLNNSWYPAFLGAGAELPALVGAAELAMLGALLVMAAVSFPRNRSTGKLRDA